MAETAWFSGENGEYCPMPEPKSRVASEQQLRTKESIRI
jgi:hypothetical protein